MKLEQNLERLEVRLRPNIAEENELIEALAELDGKYGAKNELMRQCVMRGFLLLKQKMQSVSGSESEVGAIDALAHAISGGEVGYRAVKTYLHARQQMAKVAKAEGATSVAPIAPLQAPDAVDLVPVVQPVVQPAVQAQVALHAESGATSPKEGQERIEAGSENALPHGSEQAALSVASAVEPVVEVAKKRPVPDWSNLRTVAGSVGGGGDLGGPNEAEQQ